MLKHFLQVSKVLIITNAKKGWVEYSSSILMPKVHQMIMQYIPVISARGQFEQQYQG
jgi:PhoPQ-activated pathogenicity-related protein